MSQALRPAHSTKTTASDVVLDLIAQLGDAPEVLFLFSSPAQDFRSIQQKLRKAFPQTKLIGCTSAGEISTKRMTLGGVSAGALGKSHVKRAAVALASFEQGVQQGMAAAVADLERQLGQKLSTFDPERHVGSIFLDSTHGSEDPAHIELGNAAPLLSFVGGSAGDDLAFKDTYVFAGEGATNHGVALLVMETARPFKVIKQAHFESTGTSFRVTRVEGRMLLELDGRPAADVYSEYLKVPKEKISFESTFSNPAGLIIDGEPWIRQALPPFVVEGGVVLGGQCPEGSQLHFLRARTDLVSHFKTEMAQARAQMGGSFSGVLMFDCALRRLELEHAKTKDAYAAAIDFPAVGYSTHGESWLGHMHQTLTALAFS